MVVRMSERTLPDWSHTPAEDVTWLDDDHALTWSQWPGETEPHGGVLWHRKGDGSWCAGSWYVRPPMHEGKPFQPVEIWILVSQAPVTLSPSFLCHCGEHGWIRDSTWVKA